MEKLQILNYSGTQIRTVEKSGQLWWVLSDVCKVLALSNPSKVAQRLDEDERSNFELGRQGMAIIINESGLYNVILRSDKPEAKYFKRWVTHEVLPAIRKTGCYVQSAENPYEYFDKTYHGKPVLSVADVIHFTGLTRSVVDLNLRSYRLGIDYSYLENENLAEFKKENPKVSACISNMNVITESGFNKLCRQHHIRIEKLKCFQTILPSEALAKHPRQSDEKALVNACRQSAAAIITLMDSFSNGPQFRNGIMDSVQSLSTDIIRSAVMLKL